MLMSLLRKERELGIKPDPAVDNYLKARACRPLARVRDRRLRPAPWRPSARARGRRPRPAPCQPPSHPECETRAQASAVAGGRESVVTDYMLKLLGLDVCAGVRTGSLAVAGAHMAGAHMAGHGVSIAQRPVTCLVACCLPPTQM